MENYSAGRIGATIIISSSPIFIVWSLLFYAIEASNFKTDKMLYG